MPNIQNLRPFNTLSEEEHRELSRRGGIASGESRRDKADAVTKINLHIALQQLADESRKNYHAAIKRYVKEERKKAKRRKKDD